MKWDLLPSSDYKMQLLIVTNVLKEQDLDLQISHLFLKCM